MESCIAALMADNVEAALVHLFPALDSTARLRRPKARVGSRIQSFIDDELEIITHVATRNILRDISFDGLSIPQAIYEFARNPIAHEGELDPRLNFDNDAGLSIGQIWNLPPSFVTGLVLAVVVAPENSNERFEQAYQVNIWGTEFDLSTLWGCRQQVREWLEQQYGRSLFDAASIKH